MPLKYQYLGFIILIHAIIVGLLYYLLIDRPWYFMATEPAVILSLFLSYKIYQKFLKPLELMKSGIASIKDEDFNVSFLETESRDINELITVFNAMLDKLRTEKVRTQEQAYFLESIVNASPSGMILLDYDGHISEANPASLGILNITKLEDKTLLREIDHPLIEHINSTTQSQSKVIQTSPTNRYKCQVRSVIHRGFKRKFIIVDELSEELLKSEKAAYGKVIRMMAHEVNNSMGAVNSILQSVIDFGFDSDPNDIEFKESLEVAHNRNEELAQFIKNFADVIRLPVPNKSIKDINEIAKRAQMIMEPLAIERKISLDIISSPDPLHINCDAGQIQQVLINALKNSLESIDSKGLVTIQINSESPQITISDNGPGIADDVKEKIFTPFFSTKPTGQGIGLIISRDILQQHDAAYQLYTDKNIGITYFEISFSLVSEV